MKKHMKRISMPKQWPLPRKGTKYITKPLPGKESYAIPLLVVLRDMLKIAETRNEIKKIVNQGKVLVGHRVIKELSFPLGFFDTISIPSINKYYRIEFSDKGKLITREITEKEAYLKPCKITGKKVLKKGMLQINLHDGININYSQECSVNDSLLIDLRENKVVRVLPLKEGAIVSIIKGRYSGEKGKIESIEGKFIAIKMDSKQIKTVIENVFVTG
jgi:small subunit ribosomal protein S4e